MIIRGLGTDWSLRRSLDQIDNVHVTGARISAPLSIPLLQLIRRFRPVELQGKLQDWYNKQLADALTFTTAKLLEYQPEVEPPRWHDLWPFQKETVNFVLHRKRCLVCHDPGTGKTAIAVNALLCAGSGNNLIVCPKSLMEWWHQEILNWSREEDCSITLVTSGAKEIALQLFLASARAKYNFMIVNWDILRLTPELAYMEWSWIVGDEAHRIKNPGTLVATAFNELTKHTNGLILVTATPFANDPAELWSLLRSADRVTYTSFGFFKGMYTRAELYKGRRFRVQAKNPDLLRNELAPIMDRRLKSEIGIQLPEKLHQRVPLWLLPEQVRVYRELAYALRSELDTGAEIRVINAISKLTRLRQVTAGLSCLGATDVSAKLDVIEDFVTERAENGLSTVVFCNFRATVESVISRLTKIKVNDQEIKCSLVWGGMKPEEVSDEVERFQNCETQVFVATTRAGGVGLTLTAADTVIFVDWDWNPAMLTQAQDRIHRIGQTKSCLVMSLYCPHTVDDLVADVVQGKIVMTNEVIRNEIYRSLDDFTEFYRS